MIVYPLSSARKRQCRVEGEGKVVVEIMENFFPSYLNMILPRPLFTCSISMRALLRFACARVWMVQRSMVPSAFLREEKKDLLPISISGGRVFASRTQHKQRTIKLHKKKSLHSVGLDMLGCNRNVNSKHCDRGTVASRRKQSLERLLRDVLSRNFRSPPGFD